MSNFDLMSHRGEGLQYIPYCFSPYNSLKSELTFKPLKGGLPLSSGDKIRVIAEKVTFRAKIPKIQRQKIAHPEEWTI